MAKKKKAKRGEPGEVKKLRIRLEEAEEATRNVIKQRDEIEVSRDQLRKDRLTAATMIQNLEQAVKDQEIEKLGVKATLRTMTEKRDRYQKFATSRLGELEKADAMIGRLLRQLSEMDNTVILCDDGPKV